MKFLNYILFNCFLIVFAQCTSIDLTNPIVQGGKNIQFHLKLSPKTEAKFTLKSLKHASGKIILKEKELTKKGEQYTVNLDKGDAQPGLYKLQVVANPTNGSPINKIFHAKITVPVEVVNAKLMGRKAQFGDKLSSQILNSASGDTFKFACAIQSKLDKSSIIPHQAIIWFHHEEKGNNAYFPLKENSEKRLAVKIPISSSSKSFSYNSGRYQVKLIAGDSIFEKSIIWDLGSIELQLGAAPAPSPSPLYAKPLLHDSDVAMNALPEIEHIMRPADSRPPQVVSYFFSALVLLPLFGFFIFLKTLNVNLQRLSSGGNIIWDILFFGSFAIILGLLVVYWIQLTMFQVLKYISIVGILTLFSGHRALRNSAQLNSKVKKN